MGVLTDVWVAVRPDTSDFEPTLRRRLRNVDSESAGRDVGSRFGNSFAQASSASTARRGFFKSSDLTRQGAAAGVKLGGSLARQVGQAMVGTVTQRAGAALGNVLADKAAAKLGGTKIFQRFTTTASKAGETAGTKIGAAITKTVPARTRWERLRTPALAAAAVGAGVFFGRRFGQSASSSAGASFKMSGKGGGLGGALGGLKGGIAGLAATLVGGGIFSGLKSLATSASDINETISKSRTIFKGSSGAIESWAKGAARNLGMSRQAALDGAAAFGNLFDQLGFGAAISTKMSKGFVQMSTDAASFNNANPSEVMEAFLSATRGEYDALQKYIPTANAASIEAEALRLGLAKGAVDTDKVRQAQLRQEVAQRRVNEAIKEHGRNSTEAKSAQAGLISAQAGLKTALAGSKTELTAADKASALYSLSVRDLGKAHGDFARTGEGFANQQRIFAANWADLKVKIGSFFLPAFTRATQYMNGEGFPALTRIVGALGRVGKGVVAMARAVVGSFAGSFAPAIDGATINLTELADWFDTHQEAMIRFFYRLGLGAIELGRAITSGVMQGIRSFGDFAGALGDFVGKIGPGLASIVYGMAEVKSALGGDPAPLRAAGDAIASSAAGAATSLAGTKIRAYEAADALGNKAFPAFDKAANSLARVAGQEIWSARQRDAAARAKIAIRDIGTDANGSQIKLKTWNDRTKLGADAQKGLAARIKTARDRLIEHLRTGIVAGNSQATLTHKWELGRASLYREFRQMRLSKEEAGRLADKYSKVPKDVETRIKQPGMTAAQREAKRLKGILETFKDRSLSFRIAFASNAANFKLNLRQNQPKMTGATGGVLTPGKQLKLSAAPGSVLPGYSPGRDPHHFYSATGGQLDLSGGEGIARPEVVRALGVERFNDLNAAARRGGVSGVKRQIGAATGGVLSRDLKLNYSANRINPSGAIRAGEVWGESMGRAYSTAAAKAFTAAAAQAAGAGTAPSNLTAQGRGMAAAGRAGRRLGASYVAFHRDPSGYPSYDMGATLPVGRRIVGHLLANRGAYGVRYIIHNMRIWSARNWGGRPYTPIASTGDFRHVAHVHSSYPTGGILDQLPKRRPAGAAAQGLRSPWGLSDGALIRGGRGGVLAHIGETSRDELVTPLPPGWARAPGLHKEHRNAPRPLTIILNLADDLKVIVEGVIDEHDEFKASVGRSRHG